MKVVIDKVVIRGFLVGIFGALVQYTINPDLGIIVALLGYYGYVWLSDRTVKP